MHQIIVDRTDWIKTVKNNYTWMNELCKNWFETITSHLTDSVVKWRLISAESEFKIEMLMDLFKWQTLICGSRERIWRAQIRFPIFNEVSQQEQWLNIPLKVWFFTSSLLETQTVFGVCQLQIQNVQHACKRGLQYLGVCYLYKQVWGKQLQYQRGAQQ